MKNTIIFSLLTLALLISGCRKDEYQEIPSTGSPSDFPVSVSGNINGLIVNDDHEAVPDAVIELDGQTVTSDEYGFFRIENASALTIGSLVKVEKDGYYNGFKFVRFEPGQNSIIKISLVEKTRLTSYNSSDDLTLDVNGAQLELQANSIISDDGTPYTGIVYVSAHWYDPEGQNTTTSMPGDLRGLDRNGEIVQLVTYGMMVVELTGSNEQKLNLNPEKKATMTFPLPGGHNSPDQLPMWHLDESTGVWIEEGVAMKQGDSMVAEVSHFSFWNCDDPFPVVDIKGRIVDSETGTPLSGIEIVITDNAQMISSNGFSNENGIFSGAVPMGNDLSMNVYNCGELVEVQELGILTEDMDVGDIEIEGGNFYNLTTTLLDCNGALVEDGLAIVNNGNSLNLAYSNMGVITTSFFSCSDEGSIIGINLEDDLVSEEHPFLLQEPLIYVGEVSVCAGQFEQKLILTVQGGEPFDFEDAMVTIVDDYFIHIYAEVPSSSPLRYIEIKYPKDLTQSLGGGDAIWLAGYDSNGEVYGSGFGNLGISWERTTAENVGDVITGTFTQPNASFEYVLKVDQVIQSASVQGHIWIDSNEDGIRQTTENDSIPDRGILIGSFFTHGDPDNETELHTYYNGLTVDEDGSFVLKGLIPNKEIILRADYFDINDPDEFYLSPYQIGTDVTIDNDFYLDQWRWLSDPIVPTLDGYKNVGLGIHR